jgi:hypothetical protein
MQAPVVSSITFDKTSYNPGDQITATVTYVAGKSDQVDSVSGQVTDPVTGLVGTLSGTITFASAIADSSVVSISDTASLAWTKKSDTGSVAVFTAIAP